MYGSSCGIRVSARCASWIGYKYSTKGDVKVTKASVPDKDRVDEGRRKGWIARDMGKIQGRV